MNQRHLILGATFLLCAASMFLGWLAGNVFLTAGGGIGFCYVTFQLACSRPVASCER